MKYTKLNDAVQEVHSCQKCPHMAIYHENGKPFMKCVMKTRLAGRVSKRNKKLIGNWAGAYHASCPLPSSPQSNFPEVVE